MEKIEKTLKPRRRIGKTLPIERVWLPTGEFMKYTGLGRDAINEMRDTGFVKVAVMNRRKVMWNVQSYNQSLERATVNETVYAMQQQHLENQKKRLR